jgi:hypothetical protein
MAIVRCPRCRDEVTVPSRATSRALVRCPLCLEQYLLAEALADAPPSLVIIGGEVETAAIAPSDEHSEYRVSPSTMSSTAPPTGVVFPRPVVQARPRPRRPEKNGVVLAIHYILGGVMGLALGLLVLWWGFQRDPLELGPKFAKYVPWIVPVRFQNHQNSGSPDAPPATEPGQSVKISRSKNPKSPTAKSNEPENDLASLLDVPDQKPLPDAGAASTYQAADEEMNQRPMPDLRDLLPDGPPEKVPTSP